MPKLVKCNSAYKYDACEKCEHTGKHVKHAGCNVLCEDHDGTKRNPTCAPLISNKKK